MTIQDSLKKMLSEIKQMRLEQDVANKRFEKRRFEILAYFEFAKITGGINPVTYAMERSFLRN